MPRDVRDAYLAPYDSWANRIAVHRFVQDIPLRPGDRGYDLVSWVAGRPAPASPTCPMLIGWGMKDFVFDRHFLDEWEPPLPRGRGPPLPEAGHYVLEDEAETPHSRDQGLPERARSPSTATATQAAES